MAQWCVPALENLICLAREHGDVVPLPQFGVPFYLFNHPEQIEEILRRKQCLFKKASYLAAMRPLLGDGLFTSEGETWRRHRLAAQPLFAARQVEQHAPVVVDSALGMLARWQPDETRDFHAEMMRLTLEIVIRTLFDVEIDDVASLNRELEAAKNFYTDPRLIWSATSKSSSDSPRHDATRLDATILEMIHKRRTAGACTRTDLLSRLLLTEGADGAKLSDAELRDQIVTHFIAGQETTALTLTYACALVSQHADVESALHAELNRVLGERPPTANDVAALPFAEAVIKEAIRLYPPVWAIGREALEDCEIGGHQVPKGAQVLMSQYLVHRDPRFWSEPEQFDPARWTNEATKSLPRCAYFPFGDGPRVCVGAQLASLEAVLLLATIAQRYRLELTQGQSLCLVPSMTLRPRDGVKMVVRSRN
jgi:cytochrome P450